MSLRELDRVQLEGQDQNEEAGSDGWGSDDPDDTESDVTAEEEGDGESAYEVDFIKCAHFTDSRSVGGHLGWHYHIAWRGYLKQKSDTREPISSFINDDDTKELSEKDDNVKRFWKAAKRKTRLSTKEPLARMEEIVELPPKLAEKWFKEIGPSRSLTLFRRRRARERAGLPIRKRDSDYYLPYNKKARAEAKKAARAARAGTSGDKDGSAPPRKKKHVILDSDDDAEGSPEVEPEVNEPRANSPADSLDILTDDDDADDLSVAMSKSKGTAKRKRSSSPVASTATTGSSSKSKGKERETDASRARAMMKSQAERDKAEMELRERKRRKKEKKKAEELARLEKEKQEERARRREEKAQADRDQRLTDERMARLMAMGTIKKNSKDPTPVPSASKDASRAATPSLAVPARTTKKATSPLTDLPTTVRSTPRFGSPEPGIFEQPARVGATSIGNVTARSQPSLEDLFAANGQDLSGDNTVDRLFADEEEDEENVGEAEPTRVPSPTVANADPPQVSLSNDDPLPVDPQPTKVAPTSSPGTNPIDPRRIDVASSTPDVSSVAQATQAVPVDPRRASAIEIPKSPTPAPAAENAVEPALSVPSDPRASLSMPGSNGVPRPSPQPAAPIAVAPLPSLQPPATATPPPPPSTTATPPPPPPTEPPPPPPVAERHPAPSSSWRPSVKFAKAPTEGANSRDPIVIEIDDKPKPRPVPSAFLSSGAKARARGLAVRPSSQPAAQASSPQIPSGPASGFSRPPPSGPSNPTSSWTRPPPTNAYAGVERNANNVPLGPAASYPGRVPPSRPAQPDNSWSMGPGGTTPLSPGYGGMSPIEHQPRSGASPVWQPNGASSGYNAAADPRRARPAPANRNSAPTTPEDNHASLPTPVSAWHERHLPPLPENQAYEPKATAPKPTAYVPRKVSNDMGPRLQNWISQPTRSVFAAGRLIAPIRPNNIDAIINVRFVNGLSIADLPAEDEGMSLRTICSGLREDELEFFSEELDAYCLWGQLACGSRILEWAKVTFADEDFLQEWNAVKGLADKGRIFAAYTDRTSAEIARHYAIVFVSTKALDFGSLGIDLGNWKRNEIGIAALLISLPLDSDPFASLPNPVRPNFEDEIKPAPADHTPRETLEAYGMSKHVLEGLSNRPAQYRFSHDRKTPLGVLQHKVHTGFKAYGVLPAHENKSDAIIIENARAFSSIRSTTVTSVLPRRTAIMTIGPTLSLLPRQWHLRTIWQTGGLVTFSPTFILRSPEKFAEIVKLIRSAPNWAAYIVPAVLEWASMSWDEPLRCPDSTKAFECLTRSLFLDEHMLRFSGSAATSGGGLAVSTCPPSVHLSAECTTWLAWLKRVTEQRDFSQLVEVCRGVRVGDPKSLDDKMQTIDEEKKKSFVPGTSSAYHTDLELIDIEKSQIEDLVAMRMRNELLPYRRYLFVGEMSLDRASRERASNARAIEYVTPDDFVAVFSGAI